LERWQHDAHGPGLARMNADPEVTRYVGGGVIPRAASDDMSRRLEAHWDVHGYGLWAVIVEETDAMVGFVGVSHPGGWPEVFERVEAGWRFAREAWGFGYATEGAREAVRQGCEVLGLAEIVSF